MVRTRASLYPHDRHQTATTAHAERRRRGLTAAVIVITVGSALAAIEETWNRLNPEPYHTSALSGRQWVQELLDGHRDRMKDSLGTPVSVFRRLEKELVRLGGLRSRRYVDTTEQLAIFLYQAVTNSSVRQAGERFQRSYEVISRYVNQDRFTTKQCSVITYSSFHTVLDAILSPAFSSTYMKLPPNDIVPERIRRDPKLFPFFKDCRGAIDGSHLPVHPPTLTRGRWRNREGNLTQNMLAVYDFNMFFVYVMVGWEGSIADSTLYEQGVRHGGLSIGRGLYWIADAGFASCDTLLVPYRNTRYHLREWAAGNRK